jgi:hypothetical protein
MEYDHGVRITKHLYEMSPIEKALAALESKAKIYYSKPSPAPKDETPKEKVTREAKRKEESDEALAYLAQERVKALNIISVQATLEVYRNEYRVSSSAKRPERKALRREMKKEKHHPADKLARYMRADGRPQPSNRHTAHHIVQGKGKTENADKARVQLHFYNVRINDPDNGVWMPRHIADKGHWAMPSAPAHSQIHTHNYENWVNTTVQGATGEGMLRARLRHVRTLLRDGNQPVQVTQPPDKDWKGVA